MKREEGGGTTGGDGAEMVIWSSKGREKIGWMNSFVSAG